MVMEAVLDTCQGRAVAEHVGGDEAVLGAAVITALLADMALAVECQERWRRLVHSQRGGPAPVPGEPWKRPELARPGAPQRRYPHGTQNKRYEVCEVWTAAWTTRADLLRRRMS